jgi:uncharacterized protein YeeX (DUF496 family)
MAESLYHIKVLVSDAAMTSVPQRPHQWRKRTQREQYHFRVNKKWRKRFGMRLIPGAYMLGSDTMVAHPTVLERMKRDLVTRIEDDIIKNAWGNV